MLKLTLKLLLALTVSAPAAHAQAPQAPYPLAVWASVLFGPDGRAVDHRLVDEAQYPGPFAAQVKQRLARTRIDPPRLDGAPTTLRTGVRIDFLVTPTPAGGDVSTRGLQVAPLPLKEYFASYPDDVGQAGGWQGEVVGTCKVGVEGRCVAIEVSALPGIPDSVRRYARASLAGWLFEPQQLGGQAVEGEYTLVLRLNTLDHVPEDFRLDKFQRIINSR